MVVPAGVDDPCRPSGGNAYDRRLCAGLPDLGWRVQRHLVAGDWPEPDDRGRAELRRTLDQVPDDAVVVVDGLLASTSPAVLVPAARRVRLVVLVHLLLGAQPPGHLVPGARESERAVLACAQATVTTSRWSRELVLRTHPVAPERVHVAEPGTDPAPLAPASPTGERLLCAATVAAHKGHDVLVAALEDLDDLAWRCTCAGPLDRDPAFVTGLRRRVDTALAGRVHLPGPLVGSGLDRAYAGADLVVLPSRGETHGMVVGEALARGLPVVASAVGGVPDALGLTAEGERPGLLVPPDDAAALAAALRRWLTDRSLRARLRCAAGQRRTVLPGWSTTVRGVADVLDRVAA